MFRGLFAVLVAVAVAASASPADAARKKKAKAARKPAAEQSEARQTFTPQFVIGTQSLERGGSTGIDVSRAEGGFRGIRVRATKGPIDFTGIRIVYSDDTFHLIEKNFRLKRGEQTKVLDERDPNRFVNQVFLSYKDGKTPMSVEVIGVRTPEGAAMSRTATSVAVAVTATAPLTTATPTAPVATPAPATPADPAAAAPAATEVTPAPAAAQLAPPAQAPGPPAIPGSAAVPAKEIALAAAKPAPLPPPAPAVVAAPATIAEGRDVMFGYQSIALGNESDVVRVGSDVGKFHALRFKVQGGDVRLNAVEISYANGETQRMGLNADVKSGKSSNWYKIDKTQFIQQIRLSYKAKNAAAGQARVEVVGQYADDWLAAAGEGRRYNEGWVLLGSETADAVGFDKDIVSVGKNNGGFKQVRLKVRDRSITLREVRVIYQTGPDDVIATNDRVDPEQYAGPWALKEDGRAIKEIVAVYRRRLLFGSGSGHAVVEFWGQH